MLQIHEETITQMKEQKEAMRKLMKAIRDNTASYETLRQTQASDTSDLIGRGAPTAERCDYLTLWEGAEAGGCGAVSTHGHDAQPD